MELPKYLGDGGEKSCYEPQKETQYLLSMLAECLKMKSRAELGGRGMGHKLENWLGDEKMIVIWKGCAGSIC
jgi:hypothetical protein